MGKLTVKRKVYLYIAGIVVTGICFVALLYGSLQKRSELNDQYGTCSVLLHNAVYQANEGKFDELEPYSYCVIDTRGKVIKSNDQRYLVGTDIGLNLISGSSLGKTNADEFVYSVPYIREEKQAGTIYVSVPLEMLRQTDYGVYLAVWILLLVLIVLVFFLAKMIAQDILVPIDKIHTLTDQIREGILDQELNYDYDGEIGTLCHDFEALREELLFARNKEAKLKKKEKMLLAYISHDLRTPIAIISCYVEGIHAGIVSGERQKEYTIIILNKIKMLNKLIDDILEHSKAQMHELSITKKEVYAKEYFGALMEEIKSDVVKKGLSFSYNDIPNMILNIDGQRMKQAINNLISNSMKYTKEGGIRVEFESNRKMFYITVEDTGVGIDPIDLPMIFDEFYRSEKARTLNVPGSGLGLSIVKYIVGEHQGKIECDSVKNKYTKMRICLPI